VKDLDKWLGMLRTLRSMPRRYLGAVAGFVLWVFLIWLGFFPTLLLCALVAIGYAVGRFADSREHWQDVIERVWQSDRFDP